MHRCVHAQTHDMRYSGIENGHVKMKAKARVIQLQGELRATDSYCKLKRAGRDPMLQPCKYTFPSYKGSKFVAFCCRSPWNQVTPPPNSSLKISGIQIYQMEVFKDRQDLAFPS